MKIEDQVISLELSKKLKELGVKQESLFNWHFYNEWCIELSNKGEYFSESYSAFTAQEIVNTLPNFIYMPDKELSFRINITKCSLIESMSKKEINNEICNGVSPRDILCTHNYIINYL